MEAFLVAVSVAALVEIGDKTQLLSLLFATHYRKPWPIIGGILIATAINHMFAGALGVIIESSIGYESLRWILGLVFISLAIWTVMPNQMNKVGEINSKWGIFVATAIAFFLIEIGDKTQIATIALAAQYSSFFVIVLGTTIGMVLVNIPVVLLGNQFADRLSIKWFRIAAAIVLALLGILIIAGV